MTRGAWISFLAGVLACVAVAATQVACRAPTQVVPLHLEPAGTRVFVDGQAVPGSPAALTLRSDRPHVVQLEQDGHRTQQVVLESRETSSGPRLEPPELRVRLEAVVPTEHRISIERAE
jgi:hypothetical protein